METTISPADSFIGIGASLGCGELLLALAGKPEWLKNCKGLVFVGSSLPIPLRTPLKPNGPERPFWDKLLDDIREGCLGTVIGTLPFIFGKGEGNRLSPSMMRRYERIVEQSDALAIERTVQAFLERDLTQTMEGLGRAVDFPILILHGSEDVVNPVDEGPELCRRLMPTVEIKLYEGAAHGMSSFSPAGRKSLLTTWYRHGSDP